MASVTISQSPEQVYQNFLDGPDVYLWICIAQLINGGCPIALEAIARGDTTPISVFQKPENEVMNIVESLKLRTDDTSFTFKTGIWKKCKLSLVHKDSMLSVVFQYLI